MKIKNIIAGLSAALVIFSGMAFSGEYYPNDDNSVSITAYADEYDDEDFDDEDDEDYDDEDGVETEVTVRSSGERSNPVIVFLVCLGISLVISGIVVGSMWSKLKTVHKKNNAADYQKPNSMKVNNAQDNFLYKKVDKKPRAGANK